ncbi:MAG: DUF2158 domain-containing protein [Thermodesulfobacteriota bacterium]|jgi:uncharacterized protein YodC (DUF2158 family)
MAEIKEGDKVRVKSGSPIMTVQEITDGGKLALCVWFDEKNQPQRLKFALNTLEKYGEEKVVSSRMKKSDYL